MANLDPITVRFDDHSAEVLEALRNAVERGLMAIGEKAQTYARENIRSQDAYDTGRLWNSIAYALEGHDGKTLRYTKEMQKAGQEAKSETVSVTEKDTVYIGTAVFYGPYIELGTGSYSTVGGGTHKESWTYRDEFGQWHHAHPMQARPFLKPAVADHGSEFRGLLKDSLENA